MKRLSEFRLSSRGVPRRYCRGTHNNWSIARWDKLCSLGLLVDLFSLLLWECSRLLLSSIQHLKPFRPSFYLVAFEEMTRLYKSETEDLT